jgi:hypothetical protein
MRATQVLKHSGKLSEEALSDAILRTTDGSGVLHKLGGPHSRAMTFFWVCAAPNENAPPGVSREACEIRMTIFVHFSGERCKPGKMRSA